MAKHPLYCFAIRSNTGFGCGRQAAVGFRMTFLLTIWICSQPTALAEQSWKVSYRDFFGKSDGEKPAQFVDSIDAFEGYTATLIHDAPKADWKVPPKSVKPGEWLRLVNMQR